MAITVFLRMKIAEKVLHLKGLKNVHYILFAIKILTDGKQNMA